MDRMFTLAKLAEACHEDVGKTRFFQDRGVSPKAVDAFRLGYFGPAALSVIRALSREDRYALSRDLAITPMFIGNPVFPITNADGTVIAIACRSATHRAKYINSRYPKAENLYGLSVTKEAIWRVGAAFVTEGYMDVIRAWQCGVPCVCGVLSAMMSKGQIELVARYTRKVWLVFDNDRAGEEGAIRSRRRVAQAYRDVDARVLKLPPESKDWDEHCTKTGKGYFHTSVPWHSGGEWQRLKEVNERLAGYEPK